MPLPIKTHCDRCGLPQWLAPALASGARRLQCPRCGHRATPARLRYVRERARARVQPELQLAS